MVVPHLRVVPLDPGQQLSDQGSGVLPAGAVKDLDADKIKEIREEIQAKRPETAGDESQDIDAQYEALDVELKKIEDTKRAAAESEDSQD